MPLMSPLNVGNKLVTNFKEKLGFLINLLGQNVHQ